MFPSNLNVSRGGAAGNSGYEIYRVKQALHGTCSQAVFTYRDIEKVTLFPIRTFFCIAVLVKFPSMFQVVVFTLRSFGGLHLAKFRDTIMQIPY